MVNRSLLVVFIGVVFAGLVFLRWYHPVELKGEVGVVSEKERNVRKNNAVKKEEENNMSDKELDALANKLLLKLKDGEVIIELYPDKAPNHVRRMKQLVQDGFYDGLTFHRVIDGFMAQTGDPEGNGTGGSNLPDLVAEFNDILHTRGVVSMARSMQENSANSQFFIMLEDTPHLNGQYSAFGKVIKGMEFIDKIKKGSSADNGTVSDPDKIISLSILSK